MRTTARIKSVLLSTPFKNERSNLPGFEAEFWFNFTVFEIIFVETTQKSP